MPQHVRFALIATGMMRRDELPLSAISVVNAPQQKARYSITSSARPTSGNGIVRPMP
jgi:hypothetical protein